MLVTLPFPADFSHLTIQAYIKILKMLREECASAEFLILTNRDFGGAAKVVPMADQNNSSSLSRKSQSKCFKDSAGRSASMNAVFFSRSIRLLVISSEDAERLGEIP